MARASGTILTNRAYGSDRDLLTSRGACSRILLRTESIDLSSSDAARRVIGRRVVSSAFSMSKALRSAKDLLTARFSR